MTVALVTAVALAVAFHLTVFVWESFLWTTPRVRALFGTTPETAETTRLLATNQGYYNLFLAIIAAVGAALLVADHTQVGAALVIAGTGAMAGAGAVLAITKPSALRAGMMQALPALAATVLAALTIASS